MGSARGMLGSVNDKFKMVRCGVAYDEKVEGVQQSKDVQPYIIQSAAGAALCGTYTCPLRGVAMYHAICTVMQSAVPVAQVLECRSPSPRTRTA